LAHTWLMLQTHVDPHAAAPAPYPPVHIHRHVATRIVLGSYLAYVADTRGSSRSCSSTFSTCTHTQTCRHVDRAWLILGTSCRHTWILTQLLQHLIHLYTYTDMLPRGSCLAHIWLMLLTHVDPHAAAPAPYPPVHIHRHVATWIVLGSYLAYVADTRGSSRSCSSTLSTCTHTQTCCHEDRAWLILGLCC